MNAAVMRRSARLLLRPSNIPSRHAHDHAHIVYSNPRRLSAAAMTLIATGQAGFWANTAAAAHQIPDPILSPAWSVAGFGLSAAFIAMVTAYLRRNVAEIALLNGPSLRVTAHSVAGLLRAPVTIPLDRLVPGPNKDDPNQRYWTLGMRTASGRTFYYIVDTKRGIVDPLALSAAAKGPEHLLVFSHKRDADIMRHRWQQWQRSKLDNTRT